MPYCDQAGIYSETISGVFIVTVDRETKQTTTMSRSSIYRGRQSSIHKRRSNQGYGGYQEDRFPMLDSKEISICLQSCEFVGATEELVSRPTGHFMRSLTEQLLDTFMGVSQEVMQNKVSIVSRRSGSNKGSSNGTNIGSNGSNGSNGSGNGNGIDLNNLMNGTSPVANGGGVDVNPTITPEFEDTVSSLGLVTLFQHACEFYQMCGINDFTLMDIMKPEAPRIRRILSAVVNFARFREENSIDCEELVNVSENNLDRVKQIEAHNTEVSNNINDLQNQLSAKDKPNIQQINSYNVKLETELKRLKKIQELLTLEHSDYKQEKTRLIEKLEDHNYLIVESTKELDNLKNYNQFDTSLIQKVIEDLKTNLTSYNETLANLELKNRNIGITIESFQIIEQELKNLFRILEEILGDINKEDELSDKLLKFQEFLDQQKLESNDLNRQIQQIKRQLVNLDEKIKKLRLQSQERNENSKQKLSELKESYNKLVEERTVKESELDKRKELINDLEMQMNNKRMMFQNEIRNSELAVARLNSHLKLYLTEMNKKI